MSVVNPIVTSQDEQFIVSESDFAYFDNAATRCESGVILFCREGEAMATVNQCQQPIVRNTLVLILPGSIFMLTNRTKNFRLSFFAFSRDLLAEASRRMDPAFFRTLNIQPIFYPPLRVIKGAEIWFQVVEFTYRDRRNAFRNIIIKNRIHNILLEIYDKLQRFGVDKDKTPQASTRKVEFFNRFMDLVHKHCFREREVSFYADQLCISTRYLSTIVRNVIHNSAKEYIDRSVIAEIKILLQSTDLSVQEIAFKLHFPDQSYLGRYFKKHTGQSPSEYRHGIK